MTKQKKRFVTLFHIHREKGYDSKPPPRPENLRDKGAAVLGRWGFLFLNQFGCVGLEIGLTFCYELAEQRWIEGAYSV
jgi:hypothetical protein